MFRFRAIVSVLTFQLACLAWLATAGIAFSAKVTVAVAANFLRPAEAIAGQFYAETGHEVTLAGGATGQLYAQIINGAPYDILLSADQARPEKLEKDGIAVAGSRFTYAVGLLSLWSAKPGLLDDGGEAWLKTGGFRHLAIAQPDLAPYGLAASQVIERMGLTEAVSGKLVMGQNIGQTFSMVATGNADAGFVARSQLMDAPEAAFGSRWDVLPEMHAPIRQEAVLLARAADNQAAKAFLDFLRSDPVRDLIAGYGYAAE